jgi:vacuolar-type H+-ATPase subunit F/Vma7
MPEILAYGTNEFVVGFQLAGIRTLEADEARLDNEMLGILGEKKAGIVILDKKTCDMLSGDTKEKLLQSINPVFVVLSEQESSEELRMLIKKSIGVDLWNK